MDSTEVTLTALDTGDVDSNDDGDPIPDLTDEIIDALIGSGFPVTSTTTAGNVLTTRIVEQDDSFYTGTLPLVLPGGQSVLLEVDIPEANFMGGPFDGLNNVAVMVTLATSAADLAGGTAPTTGIVVPDGSTEQQVFVRIVVLTQAFTQGPWVVYEGDITAGFFGDIKLYLEIQDATETTTASAFEFNATYFIDTNTFTATGDEIWTEIPNPEIEERTTRALVDNDGEIFTVATKSGIVIGFTADGGGALLSGGGSSSSTCFIATAAYGTPMATEIDTLRVIRIC